MTREKKRNGLKKTVIRAAPNSGECSEEAIGKDWKGLESKSMKGV